MTKINVFIVLSIIAATSIFVRISMVTPTIAQDNMTMTMTMTMTMDPMGNMPMEMDNSTSISGKDTFY